MHSGAPECPPPLCRPPWPTYKSRWRPPRRPERRWLGRRIFVPRSRLCSPTGCIEQTGLDVATRTLLVPIACAERSRSRRSHLAGCGSSGHRSTSLAHGGTAAAGPPLVRAQPRPASLERAPPDFPPEMLAVVRGPPLAPAPLLTLPSSIRRCRAPPARPPAPPPSAPRSPPPSPPPPASFSTTRCSSSLLQPPPRSLQGTLEL